MVHNDQVVVKNAAKSGIQWTRESVTDCILPVLSGFWRNISKTPICWKIEMKQGLNR